jgi:IclR family acetate operon transcriptional repressor
VPTGRSFRCRADGEFAPLHCTAHGKALLADCDRSALAQLLGAAPLKAYTRRTVRSVTRLARVCTQVRTDGSQSTMGSTWRR